MAQHLEHVDIYDLIENEDNINDSFIIDVEIDQNNRDEAFAYIDGEVYFSDEYHNDIVNDYLGEERFEVRPSSDELQTLNVPVAFGDIIDNCAFIELSTVTNCNINEVASAIKACGYDKIYEYDFINDVVTRVGKRLKKNKLKLDQRPEVNHRDGLFMFYDGEIYTGSSSETHYDLIHRISEENSFNEEALQNARRGFFDIDSGLAFGHILEDSAFIDDVTLVNTTSNEVVSALKNFGFESVYLLNNDIATRLASVEDITELIDLDDSVNETTDLTIRGIELNRDEAFLYFNGEIYTGVSHPAIINNLDIDKATKRILSELRFAPYTKRNIETDIRFAAGHFAGDIAVIEEDSIKNTSVNEVASALSCRKIYVIPSFDAKVVTRIADLREE